MEGASIVISTSNCVFVPTFSSQLEAQAENSAQDDSGDAGDRLVRVLGGQRISPGFTGLETH